MSRALITLVNANGLQVCAIPYGGTITSIRTPDRHGRMADIVLGFDDPAAYEGEHPYFGAIIGRYANRIAHGRFTLDGSLHTLATNDGPHHMHGGRRGFDKVSWAVQQQGGQGVTFSRESPDGEEGYPGTIQVAVAYSLTDDNELVIEYTAEADRPTPVNLTQHTYFNLAGAGHVLDHVLEIDANRYTPVDATGIPTGESDDVTETPFDFRNPASVGSRLGLDHPQLRARQGFDHNFVVNRDGPGLRRVAHLHDPSSGRTLGVATEEPGLQVYSGNLLDGSIVGKGGRRYHRHAGFCLETQHFPDSPNQPQFPPTILRPGQVYTTRTVFAFGVIA
jgi:aldose 1-epimerase